MGMLPGKENWVKCSRYCSILMRSRLHETRRTAGIMLVELF
jgi:hypothetical protein